MLLRAFLFGLLLSVAIGPIALLIISYGVRFGTRAGVLSALGAALGDLLFAGLAIATGSALAPVLQVHRQEVERLAAFVLIAFGLFMLRGALRVKADSAAPDSSNTAQRPLLTTFLLTVANPLTVIAFAGFVPQLDQPLRPYVAIQVLAVLFFASLTVQMTLALGSAAAGRLLQRPAWARGLNVLGALGILAYGVVGLWKS